MYLAIRGRVTSIDRLQAVVELGGVERTIGVALTPEVQVGDYTVTGDESSPPGT